MPANVPDAFAAGDTVTLAASTAAPTLDGYTFMGWSLNDDGGRYIIEGTQSGIYGSDITFEKTSGADVLYAVWAGAYSLNYHNNGGVGEIVDDNPYHSGDSTELKDNKNADGSDIMTRNGAVFIGWSEGRATQLIETASAEQAAAARFALYTTLPSR